MLSNLINFKSPPKNNFFAPEWDYYLIENMVKDINCLSLSKFLKDKEKEILKLKVGKDGYTGLGKNFITSRHDSYNLFNFKNEEISKLKQNILALHNSFLKHFSLNYKTIFIKGWYNILRKNEKIKPHLHGTGPNVYLGGHFCVQCDNTSTYYINPINQLNEPMSHKSLNQIGKLTLFQNCIPHYTDVHKSDEERITIAFDLSLIQFGQFQKIK